MPHQSFNQFRCSCRHPRRSSDLDISAPFRTRTYRFLLPSRLCDTSVDTLDTEPYLEALTQHVAGRLAVLGASAAAEVNVFIDSGSGITAMKGLVEALRRQPGMMQTTLTQAFVRNARVVTSVGQECDIVTHSCPRGTSPV